MTLLTRWTATGPGSPTGSSSKKLVQVLRFGCSYEPIADCGCSATTIRERRDEWDQGGLFGKPKTIARESYDPMAGLVLRDIAIDGYITKAPGGQCAGRSPVTAASRRECFRQDDLRGDLRQRRGVRAVLLHRRQRGGAGRVGERQDRGAGARLTGRPGGEEENDDQPAG